MSLSYTGKLFRRIAICCGAWTKEPHKVWLSTIRYKYRDEYDSEIIDGPYRRGDDNKWHPDWELDHSKDFECWKAVRWLSENGYITTRNTRNASRNCYGYVRFTFDDTEIRLTEKGLSAAPAYLKQKEE